MAVRRNGRTASISAQAARRGRLPWSDPAWEATKAARRNLTLSEAVRECDFLSQQYWRMWTPMNVPVNLDEIVRTLRAKKVPFVLTGAHGISSWTGRPRATKDIDILVKGGRNYTRAVNAIKTLYPQLETHQFFGVTGFFNQGEKQSVIDVTYPHRADQVDTLETALWVEERGQKYRVPTLECALANKYGAMLTPSRESTKRAMDAVDFATMVKHSLDEGRSPIDLAILAELGEKVWPGGGGKEIVRFVEQAKAGGVPPWDRGPSAESK